MASGASEEDVLSTVSIDETTVATDRVAGRGDEVELAAKLLRALSGMAARNRHREADLVAAMCAAGLASDPRSTREALLLLRNQRCIRNMVPLSDGGLLLTVTGSQMEPSDRASQWNDLDRA